MEEGEISQVSEFQYVLPDQLVQLDSQLFQDSQSQSQTTQDPLSDTGYSDHQFNQPNQDDNPEESSITENGSQETEVFSQVPCLSRARSQESIGNGYTTRKLVGPQSVNNNETLPFACTLCTERFPKKLHLSAHVEKRHGIKYVFTERGKKVKLVRMPESINEGDKLDPYVKLLMQNAVGRRDEILVHPVEPNSSFTGVAEELKPEDLLRNVLGNMDCGILVNNIDTGAYSVAVRNGDVPFVAFGPYEDSCRLLRIIQLTEKEQMLVPATTSYLKTITAALSKSPATSSAADGDSLKRQSVSVVKVETNLETSCSSQPETTEERAVVVVAVANVKVNSEKRQFEVVIESPVKDKLKSTHLISFQDFKNVAMLCKPKLLRCLSEAYSSIAACEAPTDASIPVERPKRKYTRRGYAREIGDKSSDTPVKKRAKFSSKLDDNDDEDYENDNEQEDETYTPALEKKEPQAKRRGRPRKLKMEDVAE